MGDDDGKKHRSIRPRADDAELIEVWFRIEKDADGFSRIEEPGRDSSLDAKTLVFPA